jgi:hypothetical protein
MRILLVANSLAYYDHENRWYDVETLEPSDLYPEILSRLVWPHSVEVVALPWMTILDALKIVKYSQKHDADIFLLHVGIVESVRRIYPISIRRAINALGARKVRDWINNLEKVLLKLPLNRHGWIAPSKFRHALELICSEVEHKYRPKLLVLVSISSVNEKFENKHPGTNRSVALHNREIERIAGVGKIRVLRADRILGSNCFLADSVHLNRRGHQLLAEAIINSIDC